MLTTTWSLVPDDLFSPMSSLNTVFLFADPPHTGCFLFFAPLWVNCRLETVACKIVKLQVIITFGNLNNIWQQHPCYAHRALIFTFILMFDVLPNIPQWRHIESNSVLYRLILSGTGCYSSVAKSIIHLPTSHSSRTHSQCTQVKALSWNRIHLLVVSIPQLSLISYHFLYQYVIYCRRHSEHIEGFIGFRAWRTEWRRRSRWKQRRCAVHSHAWGLCSHPTLHTFFYSFTSQHQTLAFITTSALHISYFK